MNIWIVKNKKESVYRFFFILRKISHRLQQFAAYWSLQNKHLYIKIIITGLSVEITMCSKIMNQGRVQMRNIININENWKFIQENVGLPAEYPADWKTVSLPHTWNAVTMETVVMTVEITGMQKHSRHQNSHWQAVAYS